MNRGSEGIYSAWISTGLISCKHDESSSSVGKSSFQRKRYISSKYIYMYYIHPELRIDNCRCRPGKGAKSL